MSSIASITENVNRKEESAKCLEREISETTDVINFILVGVGCPNEHRAFIDAVIGVADYKMDEFEASDLDIGKRMLGTDAYNKSIVAIKKRVQRARDSLKKWQTHESIILIQPSSGGQARSGKQYKSRYTVPLLKVAAIALDRARGSSGWENNPKKAIQNASRSVLPKLKGAPEYRDRFKRPRKDKRAVFIRTRNTIVTLGGKLRAIIEEGGKNPERVLIDVASQMVGKPLQVQNDTLPQSVDGFVHTDNTYGQIRPRPTNGTREHGAGGQQCSTDDPTLTHAFQMLEAFESVGTKFFGVTYKKEGEPPQFKRLAIGLLKASLASRLRTCEANGASFIVRPYPDDELVQLDDLDSKGITQVIDYAFLVIQTSQNSYHAWLRVENVTREIRHRLNKGVGADSGASRASRLAGSRNLKPEYGPDYPRVRLVHTEPGLIVTLADIEHLLAPKEVRPAPVLPPAPVMARPKNPGKARGWPSYERCLNDAPPASEQGGPDRSQADFMFCLYAIGRGHSVEEIVQQLMLLSEKAKSKGWQYANLTAQRASEYNQRRRIA